VIRPLPLRPDRLPFRQPEPYIPPKLRGDKAVTIAAGLRCVDGVVLCADTEMSAGYSKFSQSKFRMYNRLEGRPAFIYAGDRDFSFMAIRQIAKAIAKTLPKKADILEAVEKKAADIHKRYYPLSTEQRTLELEAIVVLHLNQKERGLFLINGPTVSPVDHAECIGTGSYLGTYVLQTMFSKHATVWEAAHVAAYLLFLAKTHGAYCGHDSEIMIFSDKGGWRSFPSDPLESVSIKEMEADFSALQSSLGNVLTNLLNFKMGRKEYEGILKGFTDRMEALRAKRSEQIDKYIEMEIERQDQYQEEELDRGEP
jgi:hypothetical protein